MSHQSWHQNTAVSVACTAVTVPYRKSWLWSTTHDWAKSPWCSRVQLMHGQGPGTGQMSIWLEWTNATWWQGSFSPTQLQYQGLHSETQAMGPKAIKLTDTTVLQRAPASLGIKLMGYKSHGSEGSDWAYNSSFTGWKNTVWIHS